MVVHVYRDSMPLQQINYWTNSNLQWSHQQLRTQALMAHKGQWVPVTWTINEPHLLDKTGVHIMQHQPAFRPIPGFILWSCIANISCHMFRCVKSNLNNKMTMSEGYCSVRVHWTEPKQQLSSINPLTTPSLSTKVQRVSTDTCLLANIYLFICIHLLAIIQFRTR